MPYDPYNPNAAPPFGGYRPGYNDPLSQPFGPGGMGMPGSMGQPFMPGQFIRGGGPAVGVGGAPLTSARQNEMRMSRNSFSPGSFIREPLDWVGEGVKKGWDWISDGEHGADRLAALTNLGGTVAGVIGANKDRAAWEEEMARQRRMEEEDRQRGEEYAPLMSAVLRRLTTETGG